jgi:hypothetical protein
MAHVTTLNPDGSPQVSVVWVGLDGDDLVTGHPAPRRQAAQRRAGPAGRGLDGRAA